jgi:hypothetical protein
MSEGVLGGGSANDAAKAVIGADINPILEGSLRKLLTTPLELAALQDSSAQTRASRSLYSFNFKPNGPELHR